METYVHQNQNLLPISPQSVQKVVKTFLSSANISYDEVSIHFIDNKTMCDLHLQYFDDPTPTDCISFPLDDNETIGYKVMGDVFICPETAINYIKVHGGDVYQETTLYLIHGLLHLLGYDDIEELDRQAMRDAESMYLEVLRKKKIWIQA